MSLDSRKINKLSTDELYHELFFVINQTRQKYAFVKISDKDFQNVIMAIIKQIVSSNNKPWPKDWESYFAEEIDERYLKWLKKSMLKPKVAEMFIGAFIKDNIVSPSSYSASSKVMDMLISFFTQLEYYPSPELCLSLINSHEVLQKTLDLIVNKNLKQIQSGSLDELSDNAIFLSFIESYCTLKQISLEPQIETDDDKFYESFEEIKELGDTVDTTRLYLQEINKTLLTPEEERQLAYRVMQGDQKAKEILIERNLRLVVSVAKKHLGRGLPLMDLVQEGSLGLMVAVERYDVTKGFRFSTYAVNWIRQAMTRAIADKGRNVRLSADKHTKVNRFRKAKIELEKALNREPTMEEIADYLGISLVNAKNLYDLQFDTVSLNTIVGDEEDTELEHFVASDAATPEEEYISNSLSGEIRALLQKTNLKPREIEVLNYRFGLTGEESKTLEEVGQIFGLTRERIRQIEDKAIRKLRRSRYVKALAVYMPFPAEAERNIDEFRKNPKFKPENSGHKKSHAKTKEGNEMAKQVKSIYEYFDSYSREAIDTMVASLSESDRALLTKRYGNDLANPSDTAKLTKEETTLFYGSLIPKMRRYLANPNGLRRKRKPKEEVTKSPKNIATVQIEPEAEEVEVLDTVVPLTGEETELSAPLDASSSIENLPEEGELISASKPAEETKVNRDACVKILEMLRTPSFGQMMGTLSAKEAVIISLKLGYVDGKYFSTNAIANFLGIDEIEVIETTRRVLLLYKDSFDKFLDEAIKCATLDYTEGEPKR